jgi:hypothetical protein
MGVSGRSKHTGKEEFSTLTSRYLAKMFPLQRASI